LAGSIVEDKATQALETIRRLFLEIFGDAPAGDPLQSQA
jgi:hypothetical protein